MAAQDPEEGVEPGQPGIIDLELFSATVTRFRLVWVSGEESVHDVPGDLPFPIAAAFSRAYDPWMQCQLDQVRAGSTQARQRHQRRYDALVTELAEQVACVLTVRGGDLTGERLLDQKTGLGHNQLSALAVAIAGRLNPGEWMEILGLVTTDPKAEGAEPEPEPPAPVKSSSSAGKSGRSGGSTAGPTTTGKRSGGSSSGSRTRKRPKRPKS